MAKRIFFSASVVVLFCMQTVYALDPIPQESGFSGFVRAGAGGIWFKNNLVAGNSLMDIGNEVISDLYDSPDSDTTASGLFNFEAAYTFSETRTQITLGSQIEDLAQMELSQQLAVKQELVDKSIIMAGFLFSGIPTEVWKDPYMTNSNRQETDRNSSGFRFTFDRILGSNFEASYSWRNIDIDEEESGSYLGLTSAARNLLLRDGSNHKLELNYRYTVNQKHIFIPSIQYMVADRDGEAMSNTRTNFQLSYLFLNDPITLVLNGLVGTADYDEVHPIYGVTREEDSYMAGIQLYYKNPFGWEPFGLNDFSVFAMETYVLTDANIDFYDTAANIAMAGVMLRF
ncbi:DUF2860 family protein [Desulfogranum japonicum]|uniref:DUF2860 family protein n=1 Tax=Desulfogranum japonicum TaxID=231447 RepID=UPI00041A8128|nr:DUF2860 family protein [Desulfogranum japonicum]